MVSFLRFLSFFFLCDVYYVIHRFVQTDQWVDWMESLLVAHDSIIGKDQGSRGSTLY